MNVALKHNEKWTASRTLTKAKELLRDFNAAQLNTQSVSHPRKQQWMASHSGFIKLNFDGVMAEREDLSGVGIIARSSDGSIYSTYQDVIGNITDLFTIEGLATCKAL
ncbi:hypothetical protein PTKIN_Ptkin16aG0066500 [Pterospermum kingtungense]